ncbi:MAG: PaaI family thioesterase, partial [Pseudomonadota bacterium]
IPDDTGAQTLLGYVVDIRDTDGTARCWLETGPQHGNRHGGLHGGIMACMIDNAMGYAAARSFDDSGRTRVHTLSMTTNFVAPAGGGTVHAVGRVSGGGRGTAFTEGEVVDADGRVLATATGVYKRVKGA